MLMTHELPDVGPLPGYGWDKEFSQDAVDEILLNPWKWFEKGSELCHVVRVTLAAIDDGYTMETGIIGTTGWRFVDPKPGMKDGNVAQMTLPVAMLYAFAVECWIKGLAVARDKTRSEPLGLKAIKTHDLPELAKLAGLDQHLKEVDFDYLLLLKRVILGFGRFPAPLYANQLAPVLDHETDDEGHIMLWKCLALDPDRRIRIERAITLVYDELHSVIHNDS